MGRKRVARRYQAAVCLHVDTLGSFSPIEYRFLICGLSHCTAKMLVTALSNGSNGFLHTGLFKHASPSLGFYHSRAPKPHFTVGAGRGVLHDVMPCRPTFSGRMIQGENKFCCYITA